MVSLSQRQITVLALPGGAPHQHNLCPPDVLLRAVVQRLRIEAGLSQAALAERMGVDRAYVSGLKLGQRNSLPS